MTSAAAAAPSWNFIVVGVAHLTLSNSLNIESFNVDTNTQKIDIGWQLRWRRRRRHWRPLSSLLLWMMWGRFLVLARAQWPPPRPAIGNCLYICCCYWYSSWSSSLSFFFTFFCQKTATSQPTWRPRRQWQQKQQQQKQINVLCVAFVCALHAKCIHVHYKRVPCICFGCLV